MHFRLTGRRWRERGIATGILFTPPLILAGRYGEPINRSGSCPVIGIIAYQKARTVQQRLGTGNQL